MIRILHLYPELMNLYGDYGNISVICKHLQDLKIEVQVERREIQDSFDPLTFDMIYMGSGTESAQLAALGDLIQYRMFLKHYLEEGRTALFTGNAMELFGRMIDGRRALGFADFTVETTDKRYTGDVIVRNDLIGEVVGFINKSTLIHGGEEDRLFDYLFKHDTLVDNDYEGFRIGSIYGTHLIGPVLVKNPDFLRTIIRQLAKDEYRELHYAYEEEAYETNLRGLKKRIR